MFNFNVVKTSGQAAVIGRYLPSLASGAPTVLSGGPGWLNIDQYGNLQISGQSLSMGQALSGQAIFVQLSGVTNLLSGLAVIADVEVIVSSGLQVILNSGAIILDQAASGQIVRLSGQQVRLESGAPVSLQSGLAVITQSGTGLVSGQTVNIGQALSGQALFVQISGRVVPTTVSGNTFIIGTSGTQFPASPGLKHKDKLLHSSHIFVGGVAAVNSGAGYIVAGNPDTDVGAQMDVEVDNLNKLYGIALASTQASFLSFNF